MEYFTKIQGYGAGTIIIPLEEAGTYRIIKCPFPRTETKLITFEPENRWGIWSDGALDKTWMKRVVVKGSKWIYNGHVVFVKNKIKHIPMTLPNQNLAEPRYSFKMGYVSNPEHGFWLGWSEFLQKCKSYYEYGTWVNSEKKVAVVKKPIDMAAENISGQVDRKLVEDIEGFPIGWKFVDIQVLDRWISKTNGQEYYISGLSKEGRRIDVEHVEPFSGGLHGVSGADASYLLHNFKKVN